MKKEIITICAIVLFTFIAGSANAAITVYDNNRPGWESAVGVYEEEFFTDATLNPGVSVVTTYPGYVDTTKGVWWDKLVCPYYGLTTTTWQFATPIRGYGGNWNPGVPGGPGAAIAVAINGSWVSVGEIPRTYTGQFWGFVSTEPFSAVRLSPGSNCYPPGGAWCETYELDNMVYSVGNQPPVADANGPYSGNEGSPIIFDGSGSSDPDGTIVLYEWDLDGDGQYDDATGVNPTFTWGDDYTGTIGLKVTDDGGLIDTDSTTVTVNNVPPTVGIITAPVDLVKINTAINVSANFTDPGWLDTHTAVWDWGDGTIDPGVVTEVGGSGLVTGSHTYTATGVYTIQLTVIDDNGGVGLAVFEYVVVYNPEAGFVTGGGWINSPVGAYTPDLSLTGKANFGFVSKYQKGATTPSGQTQFIFHVAGLNFHSTSYQWLVVSGPKAQFKGSGTINKQGDYGFMLTATDGQISGGGGIDKFRIKIWDKTTDQGVVYDNQMGDADDAEATDAIEGGSIVIHK